MGGRKTCFLVWLELVDLKTEMSASNGHKRKGELYEKRSW